MRLALALLLVLAGGPAAASEATDLAARVIAAYGGAETIESGASLRQSGRLESIRHGKTGVIERSFTRPDKLRIEIRIPGEAPESRILDGDQGWRDGQPAPPMMVKSMYLQAARLDLPWLIMQAGDGIRLVGPVNGNDGRDLKGLEIPMSDGLRLIAVVDAATGQIASSHGLLELSPGHGMEFATFYDGYRQIGGRLVAAEETQFAQGRPTGRTILEVSEVAPGFPDSLFRP